MGTVTGKLFDPYRLDEALIAEHPEVLRPPAPRAARDLATALAALAGRRYCLLTSSGRGALRAGLAALGAGRGSVVGMTDVTHPSALDAALALGARPEPLDVDPRTLNPSPESLEAAAPRLTHLVFTPMFSASVPPALVRRLAAERGFPVLEDASQAIGASSGGRPYGSFGEISVFSLSPHKPVSCPGASAGALLCDDPALYRRARAAGAGAPVAAALPMLALKLSVLGRTLAGLRANNAFYRRELAGISGLDLPASGREAQDFPVLARRKAGLARHLAGRGVPLGRTYEPFHALRGARGRFPGGALYAARALHLPSYPAMTPAERRLAAGAVKEFFAR